MNPKPTLEGIADAILDGTPAPLIAQMLSGVSGFAAIGGGLDFVSLRRGCAGNIDAEIER